MVIIMGTLDGGRRLSIGIASQWEVLQIESYSNLHLMKSTRVFVIMVVDERVLSVGCQL